MITSDQRITDLMLPKLMCRILPSGDSGSGKTTLLARLRGEKPNPETAGQGTGVEFAYLDVREEDSEGLLASFVLCYVFTMTASSISLL